MPLRAESPIIKRRTKGMATQDKNYLATVYKGLDDSLARQVSALPKEFNKQRFMQNCMTVLQDGQADFSKCEATTVVRTLLKGAFLGLDFFNGECYAIPYGTQCNFQTDYKGEIKLCKRYSKNPIKDIYAKVVKEGDVFEEEIKDGRQTVNFKPKSFNDGGIIGAFAIVLYQDGSLMYDTMSKAEIEHTRQTFSKAANSKAWKESYGEMCKKTVLRRLCKLIDLDFDTAEQCQAFEDGSEFDVKDQPKERYQAKDAYAVKKGDIIDADFKDVIDEGGGMNE
jgi:recombination protein RecT